MAATEKVRENRLRRMAERQGYALRKDRARDPLAKTYGHWYIVDPDSNGSVVGDPIRNLDELEEWLGDLARVTGRKLTSAEFEALLLEIRNGAHATLSGFLTEKVRNGRKQDGLKLDDARAVWHASEFALGMLDAGYLPKREALHDAAAIVARWADPADPYETTTEEA